MSHPCFTSRRVRGHAETMAQYSPVQVRLQGACWRAGLRQSPRGVTFDAAPLPAVRKGFAFPRRFGLPAGAEGRNKAGLPGKPEAFRTAGGEAAARGWDRGASFGAPDHPDFDGAWLPGRVDRRRRSLQPVSRRGRVRGWWACARPFAVHIAPLKALGNDRATSSTFSRNLGTALRCLWFQGIDPLTSRPLSPKGERGECRNSSGRGKPRPYIPYLDTIVK